MSTTDAILKIISFVRYHFYSKVDTRPTQVCWAPPLIVPIQNLEPTDSTCSWPSQVPFWKYCAILKVLFSLLPNSMVYWRGILTDVTLYDMQLILTEIYDVYDKSSSRTPTSHNFSSMNKIEKVPFVADTTWIVQNQKKVCFIHETLVVIFMSNFVFRLCSHHVQQKWMDVSHGTKHQVTIYK